MKYRRHGKFCFFDYISTWFAILFLLVLIVDGLLTDLPLYLLIWPLLLTMIMVWSIYKPNSESFLISGDIIVIMQWRKKQKIYIETQGVCIVENIVQLPTGKNEKVSYYVLKSLFDPSNVAYIPVEDHKVVLRELFSIEEAKELQKDPTLKENEKLLNAVNYVLQHEKEQDVTSK